MNGKRKRFSMAGRLALAAMIVMLSFTTMVFAEGGGRYEVNPWSFGVMADTQWTVGEDPSGENPEYVSAALARAFQQQFINAGVKLVVQVGDLTDRAGDEGFVARAAAAQPLLDAGIGFFPLRGNHETYGYLYGRDPDWNVNVPGWRAAFPQTQGMGTVYGATNFSAPDIDDLAGLSYSFDYANQTGSARFVIVDVEGTKFIQTSAEDHPVYGEAWFYLYWTIYKATATVPGGSIPEGAWFRVSSSGSLSTTFYGFEVNWPIDVYAAKVKYDIAGTEYWPGMQQNWIDERLDKSTRGTEHAFVFSHRGLMGANHADGFFGSSPASKAATQTPFYRSLMENGVRYMLSGHDHLHNRALVTDPTGQFQVQQIIHMAGSTKFYAAAALDGFSGAKPRETQISQELFNVGYYVYKIDGPRVTATYYGDRVNDYQDNEEYPDGDDSINGKLYLPPLDFIEK
ncbi:MAG: metallophosphoesterase, partial [Acidobacteria bacterium]|nr:metallophosphoesterase [Acidobacteriota bacterium]